MYVLASVNVSTVHMLYLHVRGCASLECAFNLHVFVNHVCVLCVLCVWYMYVYVSYYTKNCNRRLHYVDKLCARLKAD